MPTVTRTSSTSSTPTRRPTGVPRVSPSAATTRRANPLTRTSSTSSTPTRRPTGSPSTATARLANPLGTDLGVENEEVGEEDEENKLTTEIENFIEEDSNGGDGGDSDVDGTEYQLYDVDEEDIINPREEEIEASVDVIEKGETKAMLKMTSYGGRDILGSLVEDGSEPHPNYNVSIPSPPPDWVAPAVKSDRGEPEFETVDNPGNWHRYCFQPKFKTNKQYACHQLPTGAMPVPKGEDGKRKCGKWEFHYDGFKNEEKTYRRGATTTNLFPDETKGYLDADILRELGLTKEVMESVDALFFFQLLLPLCDPAQSGVEDDPRIAYYTDVEGFTNASKCLSGTGVSYGHTWTQTNACELLQHDAILIYDGVLGGSKGALYRRWDPDSCLYNKDIANAMTLTRFGELKRNKKLCLNQAAPKRDQPGYDPAYKYDLPFKVFTHNTNAISKKADETLAADETTWGHGGYGETGSGICIKLTGKKVSKGGQTVIIMDWSRFRPRAYIHRHKLYHIIYPDDKAKWSKNGSFEMFYLCKQLLTMVDGETGDSKKLFRSKPCITADNYFQSDEIMEWIGSQGLGAICTSARDRLPKDIKTKYLHQQKTLPKNKHAKIAKFASPVIAVKNEATHQRIHVSFQSTSSCNISTVNALNEVSNFVELRERGRGQNKRRWVIEMNEARRLYLSTYNGIDVLDHHIKQANLFYRTWKYWHAPMNHALSIAIAVAYDVYLEVAEGNLDSEWKVEKPVSRWDFQRLLAQQALKYDPTNLKYKGDEKMRKFTKLTKVQRKESRRTGGKLSATQLRKQTQSAKSRGCGDLDKLCLHLNSVERLSSSRMCAWCGEPAYTKCMLCKDPSGKAGVTLHSSKSIERSLCFVEYHNDMCIGIAKDDQYKLLKKRKKNWTEPTEMERDENRDHISWLKTRYNIN